MELVAESAELPLFTVSVKSQVPEEENLLTDVLNTPQS